MAKEKNTDLMVSNLLQQANINFKAEESGIKEIDLALKTASKRLTWNAGFPEFIWKSKDFLLVIEDKAEIEKHFKENEEGEICLDIKSLTDFAVNWWYHYAKHIVKNTNFKKIFAFWVSWDEKHHKITPIFVNENNYQILENIETFENFSEENIEKYYDEIVLWKIPKEKVELENIVKYAKELHEDLWKYGSLRDTQKPLVVSAILLALRDENFSINNLIWNSKQTDWKKIITALNNYLEEKEVWPEKKKKIILDNFSFIESSKELNEIDDNLWKTPLKYFTENIDINIQNSINYKHSEDILWRFYSEFVKYGWWDWQALWIVLTPKHITDLFCQLLQVNKEDIILDPCCGTAGFLISAMHNMMKDAWDDKKRQESIKKQQLYWYEVKGDMFTVATTNMILRWDWKSNLKYLNFLKQDDEEVRKIKATVWFMNPPYSQAKDKDTRHLSELSFIWKLLNGMSDWWRVAVIVPQSTMIWKWNDNKKLKWQILENHTLESVITLNKNTFYWVGTNPCIAIFTTHIPHTKNKRVKFFNYEDDWFEISKHIWLVKTEHAKDKKAKLLDCFFDRDDAPTKFLVKTSIEPTDEWLHSFYYFNDEIPKEEEFKKTMADYLTFEFDMITHWKQYLFDNQN